MKRVCVNWCLRALHFNKFIMMINDVSNKMKARITDV